MLKCYSLLLHSAETSSRWSPQNAIKAILNSYKIEQQGYKVCLGLLNLADKYTPERLESACRRAFEYTPQPSYKNIQTILATGQDKSRMNRSRPPHRNTVSRAVLNTIAGGKRNAD